MAIRGMVVLVANLFIMAAGIAMAGVGIWIFEADPDLIDLTYVGLDGVYVDPAMPGLMETSAAIAIGLGVFMLLVPILTCFGIKGGLKCLMALHVGFLVLMLLAQVCGITLIGIIKDKVDNDLKENLMFGLETQYTGDKNSRDHFSRAFDRAQVYYSCCGIDSYTDFHNFTQVWWNKEFFVVPLACCKIDKDFYFNDNGYIFDVGNGECARFPNATNSNYLEPCYDDIEDWITEKVDPLLAMEVVAAVAQVLAILVSWNYLGHMGKREKKGIMKY